MKIAYIDTSYILCVLFEEPSYRQAFAQMQRHSSLMAVGLLEAEVLCACEREKVDAGTAEVFFDSIELIKPSRSLLPELKTVCKANNRLRGSDAYHLAAALWIAGDHRAGISFLSFDKQQLDAAIKLGFAS